MKKNRAINRSTNSSNSMYFNQASGRSTPRDKSVSKFKINVNQSRILSENKRMCKRLLEISMGGNRNYQKLLKMANKKTPSDYQLH